MSRRVTRSQVKVKPKPEPKATDERPIARPKRQKPSASNSSSSATVKSGPSLVSPSFQTRVNAFDTGTRKMKREQTERSTAEESQFLPPRKKKKTNEQHHEDNNREKLDLEYAEMLPPEVWEMVFQQVRDPLDFQALINSSASWRKLLEKERTKFLFPLVFPILIDNDEYYIDQEEDDDDDIDSDDESGSEVAIKNFKDCRAVCKTWDRGIRDYVERYYRSYFLSSMKMSGEMEAVNEKFENDDPRINDNYNLLEEIANYLCAKHYVFVTPRRMQRFLKKFDFQYQQFKRNPILTGCVVISDFNYFKYEDPFPMNKYGVMRPTRGPRPELFPTVRFLTTSENILRNFGEHIHYLTLEIGHSFSTKAIDFQSNVYNWLKHVPNLKGLILKYRAEADGNQMRRQCVPLQEPPKLAHLEFLEVYNIPGVIFDGIVSKATSLRKVSILLMKESDASYEDYFKTNQRFGGGPEMPLTMLNMNIRSRGDLVNLESSLEHGISLKIETLCIRFYQEMEVRKSSHLDYAEDSIYRFEFGYRTGWYYLYNLKNCVYVPENDHVYSCESDEWPEWSRLFRVVELLGAESLLKLSIRLPAAVQTGDSKRILSQCPDLRLNLSKLKSLVIQIPNTTSIDFLLGMKNTLEEATLILAKPTAVMSYEDRLKEQIKFNGYFHRMMKSNIWSEMPKLKKLRVAQKIKKLSATWKEYNYERRS